MKKSLVLAAIAVIVSLFGTGCKSGFFGKATISLVDPESLRPLPGVILRLDDSKYTNTTGPDGSFTYEGIEAGNHTITCKYANPFYETTVIPVVIRMDSVNTVSIIPDIKSDAIHESVDDTLKLSSLKPGYLLFRGGFGYGVGKSTPANNLVLVYNNTRRLLLRPSYFRNYVLLKDSADALEFVRFFSNPKTFYLFRDPDPDNTFIEVSAAKTKKPSYGEMPPDEFSKLGMTEPIVTSDANNFYVTRYVVSKTRKLFKLRETVGFDGTYAAKKTLILTHMEIPLPPIPVGAP